MRYVLIVDDDPAMRRAIERMLAGHCETVLVETAEHAVRLLDELVFDVVISDRELARPGQGGVWLLGQVRERQPDALRVLMSGSEPQDLTDHIDSGLVQKWIPKPFDPEEMLGCLKMQAFRRAHA